LPNKLNSINPILDRYFELGEIKLHYVEGGKPVGTAPTIIFYHGFPSFWYSFHLQMEAFAKDYHVVAVDGLGANLSSRPDDLAHYKVDRLALQLDQLARHVAGDNKFYLVGHDWGGALSWAYAQNYPERLHKLVVLSAPAYNQLLALLESNTEQQKRSNYMFTMRDGEIHRAMTNNNNQQVSDNICNSLRHLDHFSEESEQIFRRGLGTPGAVNAGINWYRANIPLPKSITDDDFWPSREARTSVPSLLIWGESDQTFVPEFIEGLSKYAEHLDVLRLANTGHSPMLEKPAEVNQALSSFLKR
jgi:pimeloyl-ACP methyl ester carboxylesterase